MKIANDPAGFDPSDPGMELRPLVVGGFEPFGGRRRNRSWDAVVGLPPGMSDGRVRLPVDFDRLAAAVDSIVALAPEGVLLVGEAPIRVLRVEAMALNVTHATIPDNAGRLPRDTLLVPDAPLALRARCSAGGLVDALTQAGIPAELSFHAGTYACNAALFLALHRLPERTRVAFLHLPRYPWPKGPRLGELSRALGVALTALRRDRSEGAASR